MSVARQWFRTIGSFVVPTAAVGCLIFAVVNVLNAYPKKEDIKPPIEPAKSPFSDSLAGAGLIESSSENIAISPPQTGLCREVNVKIGQQVKKGDVLFKLDDRTRKAELFVREAKVTQMKAQLQRLRNSPRPEDIPIAKGKVAEMQARLAQADDLMNRNAKLRERGAVADEVYTQAKLASEAAKAALTSANAELSKLLAGTWNEDVIVAESELKAAEAEVSQTRTELTRLEVKAPIDGQVLQVNVRAGEYINAPTTSPPIVLGETSTLHVRVDIDEHDIPRFAPLPATGLLRGSTGKPIKLRFVRVEPMVIPKKSLTGDNTERVDTRVLQVIYAVEQSDQPLFVGQQVDAFIDLKRQLADSAQR